jgi:hypothetical protein
MSAPGRSIRGEEGAEGYMRVSKSSNVLGTEVPSLGRQLGDEEVRVPSGSQRW